MPGGHGFDNFRSQQPRQDGRQQVIPYFVNRKSATLLSSIALFPAEQLEVLLPVGD